MASPMTVALADEARRPTGQRIVMLTRRTRHQKKDQLCMIKTFINLKNLGMYTSEVITRADGVSWGP